jgi:hypothetical protein
VIKLHSNNFFFASGQSVVRISLQYGHHKETKTVANPGVRINLENIPDLKTTSATTNLQISNVETKSNETHKPRITLKRDRLNFKSRRKKGKVKTKKKLRETWKVVWENLNTEIHARQKLVLKKITSYVVPNHKAPSNVTSTTVEVAPMNNESANLQISPFSKPDTGESNSSNNSSFKKVVKNEAKKKIMTVAPNMLSTVIFPDAKQHLRDIKHDVYKFQDDSENEFATCNLKSPGLPTITKESECVDKNNLWDQDDEIMRLIEEQLKCPNLCNNQSLSNTQRWINPHIIQYDEI